MRKCFEGLPEDPDTEIIMRETVQAGEGQEIPVLHEKWGWRGVRGESLIFRDDDAADLADGELVVLAGRLCSIGNRENVMIRRGCDGFAFVNFNFDTSAVEEKLENEGLAGISSNGTFMF